MNNSDARDHVFCHNCKKESLIPVDSDICIKCGARGFLGWMDEDCHQSYESEFDVDFAARLLEGKFQD